MRFVKLGGIQINLDLISHYRDNESDVQIYSGGVRIAELRGTDAYLFRSYLVGNFAERMAAEKLPRVAMMIGAHIEECVESLNRISPTGATVELNTPASGGLASVKVLWLDRSFSNLSFNFGPGTIDHYTSSPPGGVYFYSAADRSIRDGGPEGSVITTEELAKRVLRPMIASLYL